MDLHPLLIIDCAPKLCQDGEAVVMSERDRLRSELREAFNGAVEKHTGTAGTHMRYSPDEYAEIVVIKYGIKFSLWPKHICFCNLSNAKLGGIKSLRELHRLWFSTAGPERLRLRRRRRRPRLRPPRRPCPVKSPRRPRLRSPSPPSAPDALADDPSDVTCVSRDPRRWDSTVAALKEENARSRRKLRDAREKIRNLELQVETVRANAAPGVLGDSTEDSAGLCEAELMLVATTGLRGGVRGPRMGYSATDAGPSERESTYERDACDMLLYTGSSRSP
ncbi:hypothetical protein NUW54_g5379 [Trametes sanguinea]|uniref:Uncharacterized protein n=1 Tax=Trametes sanguinea TaxID=158606 RepID=A0ACC1PWH4_9APHY|nr:hypothetical protein NUW54_g5379 [Trametes sanguinea]